MKILITGASGYIGTILRGIFANEEVTLLSRRLIAPSKNEQWFVSRDLQDERWWNSLPADSVFDVVFHLAELVKANVNNKVKQKIIDNHIRFIDYFTAKGAKVIYPLTAYLYDGALSSSNAIYAEIKYAVYSHLHGNRKVSFPIIHPICDSGHGLGKLIQMERQFPWVNTMSTFQATIPVLRLAYLKQTLADPISMPYGQFDIFSEIRAIKDIFHNEARINIFLLSRAIFYVLAPLRFVPSFNLLIKGRQINDSVFSRNSDSPQYHRQSHV